MLVPLTALALALPLQAGAAAVPGPPPARALPAAPEQAPQTGGRSLVDTLGPEDDGGLGLAPAAQGPPFIHAEIQRPFRYKVTIERPGTGFKESFQVQVPTHLGSYGVPVLVGFHGFGQKASALFKQTEFDAEAQARGWFLIAPLGASKKHFGSLASQQNTELVLAWLTTMFPVSIDRSRIYGVGFSMGGGACLNYAARHLDPQSLMFAAVVNHTGGVSLKHTWQNDPPVRWILEFWYGGTPAQFPFAYQQCSLIDLTGSQTVTAGTDMARNLTHIPVWHTVGTADPVSYLVTQTQALHNHLGTLGGVSQLETVVTNQHTWATLDAKAACDWLTQFQLGLPRQESTLADRDGPWFHFAVTQDAAGAFTPFTWDLEAAPNALVLSDTANLAQLDVDTSSAGLDTQLALKLTLSTADGLADRVGLDGYPVAPASVVRDGQPTTAWIHDPLTGRLTLLESDGGTLHVWQVVP